jgi:hypothetical protein
MNKLFLLVFSFLLLIIACETPPNNQQVEIKTKNGESCQVEQQCKIIVKRWEHGNSGGFENSGNVYYGCLVNATTYNNLSEGEKLLIDINKCQKFTP